jgi:hypothetical protein
MGAVPSKTTYLTTLLKHFKNATAVSTGLVTALGYLWQTIFGSNRTS